MQTEIIEEVILCDDRYSSSAATPNPVLVRFSSAYGADPVEDLAAASRKYRVLKSGFDRLCAVGLLTFLAIPSIVIAAAIAIDSEGPIFYREWRIGRVGRPFKIWKFRSMRATTPQEIKQQAETDQLQRRLEKDLKDSRLTTVGGFLRRWSLDELPQLINVICGEMSLVGPRPVIDQEVALYGEFRTFYLAAKPGMSGLWQVSGRSNVSFETRVQLDVSYVQSWSFRNDLRILMRTIPVVLRRTGAR